MLSSKTQRVQQQRKTRTTGAVNAAQQGDVLSRRRRRLTFNQLGVETTDRAVLDKVREQWRVTAEQFDGRVTLAVASLCAVTSCCWLIS